MEKVMITAKAVTVEKTTAVDDTAVRASTVFA